jgi:hypothetical protein
MQPLGRFMLASPQNDGGNPCPPPAVA